MPVKMIKYLCGQNKRHVVLHIHSLLRSTISTDFVVENLKRRELTCSKHFNPYPTAFPYGNGMVLHFYQQQESSTTKTVHKVINKGLKTYV